MGYDRGRTRSSEKKKPQLALEATQTQTPSQPTQVSDAAAPQGSATVVAAVVHTESAYDGEFTPALVAALQKNPNLSLDPVLLAVGATRLQPGQPEQAYMHPTVYQYGQTEENTSESRASDRSATLVANDQYAAQVHLPATVKEGRDLETELQGRGYVSNGLQVDQTSVQMTSHYQALVGNAKRGDDIVAYFAGHGYDAGLCGVDHGDLGKSDTFTNAQISSLLSAATTKGVHIRFIMDSCQSGSTVANIREERFNELTATSVSTGEQALLGLAQSLLYLRSDLLAHVDEKTSKLSEIDQEIAKLQGKKIKSTDLIGAIRRDALLMGLRSARVLVETAYDAHADRMWSNMQTTLQTMSQQIGAATGKTLPPVPPTIVNYGTLGGPIGHVDALGNAAALPAEQTDSARSFVTGE